MMKKILVAEDDRFLGAAYKTKLSKLGWEVVLAVDGQEALEVMKTFVPDVILLDLVMPRIDGFAVLAELKKNSAWAGIPVLVASNLGQKEDIDRSRELGAVGYVVKADLSIEELVKRIEKAISTV